MAKISMKLTKTLHIFKIWDDYISLDTIHKKYSLATNYLFTDDDILTGQTCFLLFAQG